MGKQHTLRLSRTEGDSGRSFDGGPTRSGDAAGGEGASDANEQGDGGLDGFDDDTPLTWAEVGRKHDCCLPV